jgi:hypothetical protein
VHLHPSILPEDFDITPGGQLILNLPPGAEEEPYQNGYSAGESGETGESEREAEEQEAEEPETASHATTTSTLVADTGEGPAR